MQTKCKNTPKAARMKARLKERRQETTRQNNRQKERTHKETENESVTEEHTQRRTERETEIKTEGTQATSKERKHLRDTQREKDKWTTQTHAIKRNGKQPK